MNPFETCGVCLFVCLIPVHALVLKNHMKRVPADPGAFITHALCQQRHFHYQEKIPLDLLQCRNTNAIPQNLFMSSGTVDHECSENTHQGPLCDSGVLSVNISTASDSLTFSQTAQLPSLFCAVRGTFHWGMILIREPRNYWLDPIFENHYRYNSFYLRHVARGGIIVCFSFWKYLSFFFIAIWCQRQNHTGSS